MIKMLAKKYRIKSSKEYNSIYRNGKKVLGKYIIVYILTNKLEYNRFGIATSKKIGKAVIRNKAKRQLRAIISNNMNKLRTSYDIVIVARYKIGSIDYELLKNDFDKVMGKSGLWCEN